MLKKCHDHLDHVHESYIKHLSFAVWFGLRMIGAGVAVIVHALCPAFFQQTGSRTIFELNDLLRQRGTQIHPDE